jgi:hypothetical protein
MEQPPRKARWGLDRESPHRIVGALRWAILATAVWAFVMRALPLETTGMLGMLIVFAVPIFFAALGCILVLPFRWSALAVAGRLTPRTVALDAAPIVLLLVATFVPLD